MKLAVTQLSLRAAARRLALLAVALSFLFVWSDQANAQAIYTIQVGSTVSASLDSRGEHDHYWVYLQAGRTYRIEVSLGSLDDSVLTLIGPGGSEVATNNDFGSSKGSRIDYKALVSANYMIRVTGFERSDRGTYRLSVRELSSTPIRVGQTLTSILASGGEIDNFTVSLQAGTRYAIEVLLGSLDDSVLTLIGPDGSEVAEDDDSGSGSASLIDYTASRSGTYTIKVAGDGSSDRGTYRLRVRQRVAVVVPTRSRTIRVGQTLTGNLATGGEIDNFTVSLQAGTRYAIEVLLGSLDDSVLTLIGPDGSEVAEDDDSGFGSGSLIDYTASRSGTYTIKVAGDGSSDRGTYRLRVRQRVAVVVPTRSRTIRVGQTLTGNLATGGEIDNFTVSLQADTRYGIEVLLDSLSDSVLTLIGPDGSEVAEDDDSGFGSGSLIDYTASRSGTYTIKVAGYSSSDRGTYELSVSRHQPPPPDSCVARLVGVNVQAKDDSGRTPLHYAAQDGDLPMVQCLLQVGAGVDVRQDADDATALHLASYFGHDWIVGLLLVNGANVRAATDDGRTPLHLAAEKDHDAVVELLLAAGADPNVQDGNGNTPLYLAVAEDHDAVAARLLAVGADPNVAEKRGNTPLHRAAARGDWVTVARLLEAGADITHQNRGRTTPPNVAANAEHYCLAVQMVAHDPEAWFGGKLWSEVVKEGKKHGLVHAAGHVMFHLLAAAGMTIPATVTGIGMLGLMALWADDALELGIQVGDWEQNSRAALAWVDQCRKSQEGVLQCRDAWGASAVRYRVRRGPGTQHAHTGRYVRGGQPVCELHRDQGWVFVRLADGETGWVHADGLTHRRPTPGSTPATPPTPTPTFTPTPGPTPATPLPPTPTFTPTPGPDPIIQVGQRRSGRVERGVNNRFGVSLQAGTRYRFEVSLGTLDDSVLTLYSPTGVEVASNDDFGDSRASRIDYTPTHAGVHQVLVAGYDNNTGTYELSVSRLDLPPPTPTFTPTPGPDPIIQVGQRQSGRVERGVNNRFGVSLQAGTRYRFEVSLGTLDDSVLTLYSPTGVEVASNDDFGDSRASRIDYTPTHAGVHQVLVAGYDNNTGTYELSVSRLDLPPPTPTFTPVPATPPPPTPTFTPVPATPPPPTPTFTPVPATPPPPTPTSTPPPPTPEPLVSAACAARLQGMDIEAPNSNGWPPLTQAAAAGDLTLIQCLVAAGADVQRVAAGTSPLHMAADRGHADIVAYLLQQGADVNARAGGGRWTPLHSAANTGMTEVVSVLLQAGADVHAQDTEGRTPLTKAMQGGHDQVAELLRRAGASR